MKKGQKIEIKKLRPVDNPQSPTPEAKDYNYGKLNSVVSLPVDYTAIGTLTADIETSKSIEMNRDSRNGVCIPGFFQTSPVMLIEHNDGEPYITVHTANSIYQILEL